MECKFEINGSNDDIMRIFFFKKNQWTNYVAQDKYILVDGSVSQVRPPCLLFVRGCIFQTASTRYETKLRAQNNGNAQAFKRVMWLMFEWKNYSINIFKTLLNLLIRNY